MPQQFQPRVVSVEDAPPQPQPAQPQFRPRVVSVDGQPVKATAATTKPIVNRRMGDRFYVAPTEGKDVDVLPVLGDWLGAALGFNTNLSAEEFAALPTLKKALDIAGMIENVPRPSLKGIVYSAMYGYNRGQLEADLEKRKPLKFNDANWVLKSLQDLGNLADDTVYGLTSPSNLALIMSMVATEGATTIPWLTARAGGAIQALKTRASLQGINALVDAGFGTQQATHAMGEFWAAIGAFARGNWEEAGQRFSSGVVQSVFSALGYRGAVHGTMRRTATLQSKTMEEVVEEIAKIAPADVRRASETGIYSPNLSSVMRDVLVRKGLREPTTVYSDVSGGRPFTAAEALEVSKPKIDEIQQRLTTRKGVSTVEPTQGVQPPATAVPPKAIKPTTARVAPVRPEDTFNVGDRIIWNNRVTGTVTGRSAKNPAYIKFKPDDAKYGEEMQSLGSDIRTTEYPSPVEIAKSTVVLSYPEGASGRGMAEVETKIRALLKEQNSIIHGITEGTKPRGYWDAEWSKVRAKLSKLYSEAKAYENFGEVRQMANGDVFVWLSNPLMEKYVAAVEPTSRGFTRGLSVPSYIARREAALVSTKVGEHLSAMLIKAAEIADPNRGIVIAAREPTPRYSITTLKDIIREEVLHNWQRQLGSGEIGDHLSQDVYTKLRSEIPQPVIDTLTKSYYFSDTSIGVSGPIHDAVAVIESSAKMMAGIHNQLGISSTDAATFLDKYLREVVNAHGPDALRILKHTHGSATEVVNNLLRKVDELYDLSGAAASREATSVDTRIRGEGGEVVRNMAEGGPPSSPTAPRERIAPAKRPVEPTKLSDAERSAIVTGILRQAANEIRGVNLSPEYIAELERSGILVQQPRKDLGWIARFFGSVTQQLGKVHPVAGQAADLMAQSVNKIITSTRADTKSFHNVFRSVYRNWDRLVSALDTPGFNTGSLTPEMQHAYGELRDMLDRHRIAIRDSIRNRMLHEGVDEARVVKEIPDDWGIDGGYFPHVFQGNWVVMKGDSSNLQPIETGYRHVTFYDALKAAEKHLQQNPTTPLTVKLDEIIMAPQHGLPASKLRKLSDEIRAAVNGPESSGVALRDLRDIAGAMLYGPQRTAQRFYAHAQARERNLPGWLRTKEAFEQYITSTNRFIVLNEVRPQLLEMRNTIAKDFTRPESLTIVDFNRDRSKPFLLARLDEAIEALEGYPDPVTGSIRARFIRNGWDPSAIDKAQDFIMEFQALAKLGYSPVSALVNLSQTLAATYPVLGAKWTRHAVVEYTKGIFTGKYDALFDALGIEAQSSKLEVDILHAYKSAYKLDKTTGQYRVAKIRSAYELFKEFGLFMFTKAEKANRAIAAIGGYERARSAGLSHEAALKEAQQVINRTQGLYHTLDQPKIMQLLPRPLTQFRNFTAKMIEFVVGLRGMELARFWGVAVPILGIGAIPALNLVNWAIKGITARFSDEPTDIKGTVLDKFPRAARGVPGLLGFDLGGQLGYSEWLNPADVEPSRLLGPTVSDTVNFIAGLPSLLGVPSEESRRAKVDFLRGISPAARRIYDFGTQRGKLLDPRTGDVVLKELSTGERLPMLLGLTPIRVAQEREINRQRNEIISRRGDIRKFYVNSMANEAVSGNYDRYLMYMRRAMEDGVVDPSLARAIQQRIMEKQLERGVRDIRNAPRVVRPELMERNRNLLPPG